MSRKRAVIESCFEQIRSLSLEVLEKDWVQQILDSEFTENPDIPVHYEEVTGDRDTLKALQRLSDTCSEYIELQSLPDQSQANSPERSMVLVEKSFWSELVDRNVQQNSLIALLSNYIQTGLSMSASTDNLKLALAAAGLYICLISLPGSGPYKIFHQIIYSKALETLRVAKKIPLLQYQVKRKAPSSSQTSSQSRAQKKQRPSQSQRSQSQDAEEDEEEEDQMSDQEQNAVAKLLLKVMRCLHLLLVHSSMKRSPESLELTVDALIEILQLETSRVLSLSAEVNYRHHIEQLGHSALLNLQEVSGDTHGEFKKCTCLLFKGLIPLIAMIPDESSSVTNKGLGIIKDNCLLLVNSLVDKNKATPHNVVISESVLILIQHLAARVPDKADYRREASLNIVNLFSFLDLKNFRLGLRWLMNYSLSSRTPSRVIALEILGKLLSNLQGGEGGANSENSTTLLKYSQLIFALIFRRTNDSAVTVTTQALKVLDEITCSESGAVKQLLQDVQNNTRTAQNNNEDAWLEVLEVPYEEEIEERLSEISPLPPWKVFVKEIRLKALDHSVFVRKSALAVIENILRNSGNISGDLLNLLVKHCSDPSLAIRKQITGTLTELVLENPENVSLVGFWVKGTLPLLKDVETKVIEKICDALFDCLLGNLIPTNKSTTTKHKLPWLILKAIDQQKMELYLSLAVSTWSKEKKITKAHISSLQSYLEGEVSNEAWMLLGILTSYVPCTDPGFVMNHFNACLSSEETSLTTLLNVSKVMFASVNNLTGAEQLALADLLRNLLQTFKLPIEIISTCIDIIAVIQRKGEETPKAYNSALEGWTVDLIAKIEDLLTDQILNIPTHTHSEKTMSRHIFTLGEVGQLSYTRLTKKLYLLLQCIVFFKDERDKENQDAVVFSQEFECRFVPSDQLRAIAVGSLGKMCLQNEDHAKKIIPAFGQILDSTRDTAIKTNIMYVLSDMCVRYASLVDPLIPQMTACLKDESLQVRKTTLVQLVHLLQEDYLKIRGKSKFFLNFLHTLLDRSTEIQLLSEFYIEQRLLKRTSNIMYSSFLEAVFTYNNYTGHDRYNKYELSDKEKKYFNLTGANNRDNRKRIYKYMLSHMNDEERFRTSFHLSQEILQGIADEKVALDRAAGVLQDTLECLGLEEMKMSCLKAKPQAADDEENPESMENQVRRELQKIIINKTWMKNVVEIMIPTVIELKKVLEAAKSPFIEDLFLYLKNLMVEYKDQVTDILSADPQLAKEIEYDIKKFEEREALRQEEERAAQARAAAAEENVRRRAERQSLGALRTPADNGTPRSTAAANGTPGVAATGGPRSAGVAGRNGTPRLAAVNSDGNTPLRAVQAKSRNKILQQIISSPNVSVPVPRRSFESPNNPRPQPRRSLLSSSSNRMRDELNLSVSAPSGSSLTDLHNPGAPRASVEGEADRANPAPGTLDPNPAAPAPEHNPTSTQPSQDDPSSPVEDNPIPTQSLQDVPSSPVEDNPIPTQPLQDVPSSTSEDDLQPRVTGEEQSAESNPSPTVGDGSNPPEPIIPENDLNQSGDSPPTSTSSIAAENTASSALQDQPNVQPPPSVTPGVRPVSFQRPLTTISETPESGDLDGGQAETDTSNGGEAQSQEEDEANKSKRISGQGMPRRPKTPKARKHHQLRAVSTPQVNKTMIASNLTFNNESIGDLSSITVLSPPSSIASREQSREPEADTSSFRFNARSKDAFDAMVGTNSRQARSSGGKTTTPVEQPTTPAAQKRTSGRQKRTPDGQATVPDRQTDGATNGKNKSKAGRSTIDRYKKP